MNSKTNSASKVMPIIIILISGAVVLMGTFFSGCSDDLNNPPNPNEEELITSVELQFINSQTLSEITFRFADPDGVGGDPPTQLDTVILDTFSSYTISLKFLDESKSPVEDITAEIKEEGTEHLVCYEVDGASLSITDKDQGGLPLGLEANVETSGVKNGLLVVILKHQPEGKDGSCGLGETDVEVSFPLVVE